ncbi:MAG: aspartate-semialdehyde dehydrogenase [Clostridia bacterium]|nr:aspartate-semialdehyde dehydrogenase [Clostridia bacterium]
MSSRLRAGILGATGMVGQRLITLLDRHPYFEISLLAASASSAGKRYEEAVEGRWKLTEPMPDSVRHMPVYDASRLEEIRPLVDFVFCAVNLPKGETAAMEEAYAKAEIPVVSNNSAHRWTPDVPMLIPEINAGHTDVIQAQRARLGTKKGFIAVKPNCSIQSFVPVLTPLRSFGIKSVCVTTLQAISGAGKTFQTFPEILDNVIPYIGGEEEKTEREPLKIWGKVENGIIVPEDGVKISSTCIRVPVTDGHMASVSVKFDKKPTAEQMIEAWGHWETALSSFHPKLPSAPEAFVTYMDQPDRPQTGLDRDLYGGMGVTVGRLREDPVMDWKFVCLSHNTLRGAAGGGVLSAELLYRLGYLG